ncbi:MAG: HesA/MoeB/ThiF family protein [Nitrososphaerales archaeon]
MQADTFSEYYLRQITMPELGRVGQQKLSKARVAIIGVGGLGSISSLYLTLAGVGYLRLVDQDTIELHNLHRQALYTRKDLRYPKVEVAAKKLTEINPDVKIDIVPENVRRSNVDSIIDGVDCVVDGLDNMSTRYIVNEACVKKRIPFVFGGALGLEGNVSIFHPPETPCLECVFPGLDDDILPTCSTRGVIGATPGAIAAIQALEAIKLLAGIEGSLKNRLLVCDFRRMEFLTIELIKTEGCRVCQQKVEREAEQREKLTWMCGRDTVNVNPPKPLSIDLNEALKKISGYKVLISSPIILVFEYKGVEVSLFRQGRMLLKNVKSEEEALSTYNELLSLIGVNQ